MTKLRYTVRVFGMESQHRTISVGHSLFYPEVKRNG